MRKVHLQLRGFTVFIDVERLEAGKFDNNLLQSIRQAKHFILVLTPRSLDRCIEDSEGKDWVHRVRDSLILQRFSTLTAPTANYNFSSKIHRTGNCGSLDQQLQYNSNHR